MLQPRRASILVSELLSGSLRGGATPVRVAGAAGAGLRTLLATVAQLARQRGFVPVCPAALRRWPWLIDGLAGRHVCLLALADAAAAERAAAAVLLARLAHRSARPHVCLTLERTGGRPRGAIPLDPMGTSAMITMIHLDSHFGPSPDDVFEAARRAEGLPARFLAELGAQAYRAPHASASVVHETTIAYGAVPPARHAVPAARGSRSRSVLARAADRAHALEARGRHAAAGRLLERAARLAEGRGEAGAAGAYLRERAWMARRRGALARAVEHADRSAHVDRSPEGQIAAGLLLATCWTDDERFAEAGASLRSLVEGAGGIGAAALRARCVLALGRVLWREAAGGEALGLVEDLVASPDLEVACQAQLLKGRVLVQVGDGPAALASARDALRRAGGCGPVRLAAAAQRLMADALAAAGDLDGVRLHVREGLQLAGRGHLPLTALQLRATLLRAVRAASGDTREAAALSAALNRAYRFDLPRVVRRAIEEARNGTAGSHAGRRWCLVPPPARIEAFLDLAHQAHDDRAAVTGVLGRLCEQVGAASVVVVAADLRVVLAAGRPWRERPAAAEQALAAGQAVPIDPQRIPPEAGEPVRCGGEIIAAIGCRWPLDATVSAGAGAILRAASLAVATHVRGLTELAPVEAPSTVWNDLLGDSAAAAVMRESIVRASRAPYPVLIEGESGSGKELVARAIHRLGPRHGRRFCAINCAALTDELVEAELFGHARGAFTGAATERAGLFEEADDGTLFLDEIGELSARAQAKLLRVLQEGEVRRVGENVPRRVDVRIVAATNRHLEHEAAAGRFRTDLRFRLDVLRIVVPPLRERAADIPVLAQHFWRQACARIGSHATLGADTVAALCRYEWPGNVRELQNTIARMAVYAPRRGRVPAAAVPAHLASAAMAAGSFDAAREEFERRYVRAALAQAGGSSRRRPGRWACRGRGWPRCCGGSASSGRPAAVRCRMLAA